MIATATAILRFALSVSFVTTTRLHGRNPPVLAFVTTIQRLSSNRSEHIRTRNALKSWQKVSKTDATVVVFAEEASVCGWLLATGLVRVLCEVHDCQHKVVPERPDLKCLLQRANAKTAAGLLCWLNADIVLTQSFSQAVDVVFSREKLGHALLVGQRTDFFFDGLVRFDEPWEHRLAEVARKKGRLHKDWGVDYFVFRRNTLSKFNLPPFVVGAWRWDNYWLSEGIFSNEITVVDATPAVSAYHQDIRLCGNYNHSVRAGSHFNHVLAQWRTNFMFMLGKSRCDGR